MTDLSDRQSDAFDNPAKMACREGNLRVLREAAFLLWQDGDRTRLRCAWCELMGATGLLTLDLLERQGVLAPGGFVGIDLDPARIDVFRQGRPDLKWVAGNLYERLEAPELANVGILNLDEYGEVGNRSAQVDFDLIRGLVKRGLDNFGEFALFWNQDLDAVVRRRQDRGQALRRHADMVCEALKGCLPRRELTSEMLLPEGSEKEIDSGFVGVVGAVEVYRGSIGGHRMDDARSPSGGIPPDGKTRGKCTARVQGEQCGSRCFAAPSTLGRILPRVTHRTVADASLCTFCPPLNPGLSLAREHVDTVCVWRVATAAFR